MDPLALLFYAVVCGLLARFVPTQLPGAARMSIGAAVGIVAALLLPILRGILGL